MEREILDKSNIPVRFHLAYHWLRGYWIQKFKTGSRGTASSFLTWKFWLISNWREFERQNTFSNTVSLHISASSPFASSTYIQTVTVYKYASHLLVKGPTTSWISICAWKRVSNKNICWCSKTVYSFTCDGVWVSDEIQIE